MREVARRKRIGAGKSRQWCTHEAMCRDAGAAMGWSLETSLLSITRQVYHIS